MTSARKTLSIRTGADPAAEESPSVKKKGRGWEVSEKRRDALHERARELRRNPTRAQDALAGALGGVEMGGYKFQRQEVIGSAIVDFACKPLMLVVELDGDEDAAFTAPRDRSLTEVGYRVERLSAVEVLADPATAAARVSAVMRERYFERRERMKQQRPTRAPRRPREM